MTFWYCHDLFNNSLFTMYFHGILEISLLWEEWLMGAIFSPPVTLYRFSLLLWQMLLFISSEMIISTMGYIFFKRGKYHPNVTSHLAKQCAILERDVALEANYNWCYKCQIKAKMPLSLLKEEGWWLDPECPSQCSPLSEKKEAKVL